MQTKKPVRSIQAVIDDKRLVVLADTTLSQIVGGNDAPIENIPKREPPKGSEGE